MLTSSGVAHVKVDLHLDSVQRGGVHLEQLGHTYLGRRERAREGGAIYYYREERLLYMYIYLNAIL